MMTLDKALLAFARVTEQNEGIPPAVREFQKAAELTSASHAAYWIGRLAVAGFVYTPEALRGIRSSRSVNLSNAGRRRAHALKGEAA